MKLPLLRPEWPAVPGVGAAMSLRDGGVSRGPWASLNISTAVGDDAEAVAENRERFGSALGARPHWLRLVHGADVLRLTADSATAPGRPGSPAATADAAWTSERGLACTVTAADCLPVFFALRDGSAVAAAHAGWRGLALGVLEAAVQALCAGTGARPADLQAWLGPCIGPRQFEVGVDVLQFFGQTPGNADPDRFVVRRRADGAVRWLANLPRLAQDRLQAAGVTDISLAGACTVEDPSRFFSFRRDGVTGRMAAAIWRT
jgi:YfiH family protein